MKRLLAAAAIASAVGVCAITAPASAAAHAPTCSTTLGIAVHGQHVIGDYVTGIGHDDLAWPAPGAIGAVVGASGGAAVPGGPSHNFRFQRVVGPGASFCTGSTPGTGGS